MPRMWSGNAATPVEGRVGVVVSKYNENITGRLLQGALDTLRAAGVPDDAIDVAWVPGAWEIPLVARELTRAGGYAAVVCLGAVIRGETTHDEHINRQVSLSLGQIALDAGLPVAFGVLTCNTLEQALQRAGGNVGNKGQEAAEAALEMARLLGTIRASGAAGGREGAGGGDGPLFARSYHSMRRRPGGARDDEDGEGDGEDAAPIQPREPRPMFAFPVPKPSADSVVAPRSISPQSGTIARGGAAKKTPRPRRRRAREVTLQMLYADDLHPSRNMAEAESFVRHRLNFDTNLVAFGLGLLSGVRKNRPMIDLVLAKQATNWSLARMAVTDRNVLRLGAYEILYTDTPRVVVINEAVDLARRYGSKQSASFVNGILDRLQTERRGAPAE